MEKKFTVNAIHFINETNHDPKTLTMKICRLWGMFWPSVRDIIIIEATKDA